MAKMRLDSIVTAPGFESMPSQAQIDIIRRTVESSREAARGIVMMQNPDILRKATDAKLAQLKK